MEFLNADKRIWDALTDKEQGLLLLAWHNGLQIQYWDTDDNEWSFQARIKDCAYSPFFGYGHSAFRIKPEPVKQVHWMDDFGEECGSMWHDNRDDLIGSRIEKPMAVIRREIVDGVVSYYKEDV
jgi:hypothetical protein